VLLTANPLLSKEGRRAAAGFCSKSRARLLIDAREAFLINRYCSPLNRPPQPSLREGIPALLRRGMALTSFEQHALAPGAMICRRSAALKRVARAKRSLSIGTAHVVK
jgi:hypothetical protein